MTNNLSTDSIKAFQIKECYELATQFEPQETAKEVLRKRSKNLDVSMSYVPVQADVSYNESEMQIISDAIYSLSLEGYAASEKGSFNSFYKIDTLPSSAEKEFLLAILALRNGTNETQRIEALKHISVALSYSPNDPRFITLGNILQETGNK